MESWAYWWSDKSCTYQDALCRELSMMQNCNRDRLYAYTRMAMSSQNTEIERLKWERDSTLNILEIKREEEQREHNSIIKELRTIKSEFPDTLSRIKAEAIKEFAERLLELTVMYEETEIGTASMERVVTEMEINKVLEEMTEEQ